MPSPNAPISATWAGRPRGRDSTDSTFAVHFDDESQRQRHSHPRHSSLRPEDAQLHQTPSNELRRRRSSLADRVHALRSAGGLNSFDNFTRSWQRAAGFYEVTPVRQSFKFTNALVDGGVDDSSYEPGEIDTSPISHRSLLREQLQREEAISPQQILEETDDSAFPPVPTSHGLGVDEESPLLHKTSSRVQDDNIFTIEPQLASPFGGSYGSTWGSLASRVNEPSMRHAGKLFRQQQLHGTSGPDKEREPLLVAAVQDEDGKVVNVVVGQSTLPQTVFNSVNVLVGVGLLALPLAMRYAGWVIGVLFLCFAAIATSYTAKLLAKCADVDNSLITFADLAYVSFGKRARLFTSLLFSIELVGACVALIVLFADSLSVIWPGSDLNMWKGVCGLILLPLAFVPLRLLSFTSIIGIICTFGITLIVLFDGLTKRHAPGSLRDPAVTFWFPKNWMTLPVSLGLLMSPWGGHSVFPNIYRDMRHPYRYRESINITYLFTLFLDLLMGVIGYRMYGEDVKDEITRNIAETNGFRPILSWATVVAIAIIPITKVPLNARPIVSTLEIYLGLDARAVADDAALIGMSGLKRGIWKIGIRVASTALFVFLAILIPSFDTLMSLIGSVACFTICIILPCAFHLKLFHKDLSGWHKALDWSLIVICTILALVSTAFNCIPKNVRGF